jgi:hypothetical protein
MVSPIFADKDDTMQKPVPITNFRRSYFTIGTSDRQKCASNSSNAIVGMFYALVPSSIFWLLLGAISYELHLILGRR